MKDNCYAEDMRGDSELVEEDDLTVEVFNSLIDEQIVEKDNSVWIVERGTIWGDDMRIEGVFLNRKDSLKYVKKVFDDWRLDYNRVKIKYLDGDDVILFYDEYTEYDVTRHIIK